jgi:sugar lactone lactonase YvrE
MLRFAFAVSILAVPLAHAVATQPPSIRAVSLPRGAVVGQPWRAAISIKPRMRATLEARGPQVLRVSLRPRRNGVAKATLRFPAAGSWTIKVRAGARARKLGTVAVDVRKSALITDPFAIAVEPSGSILVGQLRASPLLRISNGAVSKVADGPGVFNVTTVGDEVYAAGGNDGRVYRIAGSSFVPVTGPLDAGSVDADAAGDLYVSIYVGYIRKVAPDGTVTTIAGNGTEGYSGDGGPATAAALFHPHAVAVGRDNALYVADTENRHIRRIDLMTGLISTVGSDVGITVALDVAPDGSIYSADVVRDGVGGGVTRTTTAGVTTRLLSSPSANGVAVGQDGRVYVNFWEPKRIGRLNPVTHRVEPVARG